MSQVEASEGYVRGETPLLIAGQPQKGNYPNVSQLYGKANTYATWGLTWETFGAGLGIWRQFIRMNLGIDNEICTEAQFADISASDAFQQRPLYPAAGSVQTLDGVLVVKVSDTSDWTY